MHRQESLKRKISSITNETDPDTDEDDSNQTTKNIIVKEKIENKKVNNFRLFYFTFHKKLLI